jgi:hypothetical protein
MERRKRGIEMDAKKEKMRENLNRTEGTLRDLVYGDNRNMTVNVTYGMLGEKRFTLQLSKQMTLDAYTDDNESDAITSFPVLDVTVNRRAFLAKKHSNRAISPEGLAILIHKSARKLPHYENQ